MSNLSRARNVLLMSLLSLSGAPAIAQGFGADAIAVAERSLRQALASTYPQVEEWTIEPLVGKRHRAGMQETDDARASVVHVGKRSAVRLMWDAERRVESTTVWFAVNGVQSLPTALQDIRTGAALSPEMVGHSSHDVFAAACTALSSPAVLTGMRAKRRLHAGDAVCAEAIEPRPPVARGESVVVRSTAGAVTITAKAVAQQDGALGQVLRVKNPASGEVYLAAVSGAGEVVVHD